MRTIKFRAWNTATEEMMEWPFETFEVYPGGIYEVNGYLCDGLDDCAILMQYTGKTDQKGKEICEGDIMGGCKVVFDCFTAAFVLLGNDRQYGMDYAAREYLVSGNIYQHENLLR